MDFRICIKTEMPDTKTRYKCKSAKEHMDIQNRFGQAGSHEMYCRSHGQEPEETRLLMEPDETSRISKNPVEDKQKGKKAD